MSPSMNCFKVVRRNGFTLVEMLVAMAVTLLMMAALGRSFGFVGEKVRDSRGDVEMSGRLVDINARLADELRRCTVPLRPALGTDEPNGYFLYSEGPVTDVTSSLFSAFSDVNGDLVLDDSRFGDFDDYLAFTAVAEGDSWFTGIVPRFVLDHKTAELAGRTYNTTDFPDPFEPIVIRSKHAEIIYFASPEYQTTVPTPAFIDVDAVDHNNDNVLDGIDNDGDGLADGNGFPDRLNLHRRVLLIRPDLNLASGSLPSLTNTNPSPNQIWMRADDWPSSNANFATTASADPLAWLYGMAGVHQQCDLSLRRFYVDGSYPTSTAQTGLVAANSLADLSIPHNRFAHVRVPGATLGSSTGTLANPRTSMPILAKTDSLQILRTQASTVAPPLAPNASATANQSNVVTPVSWSGFLRPEFVLGNDARHINGVSNGRRQGEDLLTNNALAMDIQIYDPEVWNFTTSNGLVVSPNDAAYRGALVERISNTTREFSRGGFVDLAYPLLAGGSIRGWTDRNRDRRTTTVDSITGPDRASNNTYLETPFSGVEVVTVASAGGGSTDAYRYSVALSKSGLLLHDSGVQIFQPAFDTYTTTYERDGFHQAGGSPVETSGTFWNNTGTADLGANSLDDRLSATIGPRFGVDDYEEKETSPPFVQNPEAIRVTIRIENPSTRQIRQASVVHRD